VIGGVLLPNRERKQNERHTMKKFIALALVTVGVSVSSKEALLVSLNERGRVDLDHMSDLLNKPVEEFLPELKGLIFRNPQTNEWETDDQYLSGNVREKLAVADAAAVTDPRFTENVEALKSVQPADLAATEIDVRLGSAWLPPGGRKGFHQWTA
jgi:N12 class adenine-specific DNA methylase